MVAAQQGSTVPISTAVEASAAIPVGAAAPHGPGTPRAGLPRQRPVIAIELTGIASLAVRDLLNGPRQEGRIIAPVRGIVFAEFPGAAYEPCVVAVCGPDAIRLPNAIIAIGAPPPAPTAVADILAAAALPKPLRGRPRQPTVYAGGGMLRIGGLTIRARRWWDPSPVVGPLSRTRLDHGATALGRIIGEMAPARLTMGTHPIAKALAACCASGDLATAVEHAEALVGLGPGMVPGGDGVISGMLLALRLLGGAIPGGTRAVWLADWLSAAVTSYARQRTTPLAASLLSCASRGQAAAEVSAVLHGVAGQEGVEPTARKLLAAEAAAPGTSPIPAVDIAWGLVAGCRAAQVLSVA